MLVSEWQSQDHILGFSWLKSQVLISLYYSCLHLCMPWLPSDIWWLNKFSPKIYFLANILLRSSFEEQFFWTVWSLIFKRCIFPFSSVQHHRKPHEGASAEEKIEKSSHINGVCFKLSYCFVFLPSQSQNTRKSRPQVVWQCHLLFLK